MIIFEFDISKRMDEINLVFDQVTEIKNSLSDNRRKYRDFSQDIMISQDSILNCCERFERVLLINCYTFSEQFVKNFFYDLINKGGHANRFLNCFIDNKLPVEKFSPNVNFKNIESNIKKDLYKDFKFILNKNVSEIKVYDEMVRARHTYAHYGNYNFDFGNFAPSIKVMKYIVSELLMLRNNGESFRKKYQDDYAELKYITISCIKISKKNQITLTRQKIKEVRQRCQLFLRKYQNCTNEIKLLEQLHIKMEEVSRMDLRGNTELLVVKVDDLKRELTQ